MSSNSAQTPAIKNPNPQGKGLTPILNDWQYFRPAQPQQKNAEQLFADYFTSILILSAHFRFKPVINQHYYLYFKHPDWNLSLIEPERWGENAPGVCLGQCQLHPDMTWSLNPQLESLEHEPLQAALALFADQLSEHVQQQQSAKQLLPFFAEHLPYYRRMAASGLARSISTSTNYAALLKAPAGNPQNVISFLHSTT